MSLKEVLPHLGSAHLVAVSKLQSPDKIRSLYHEGQRIFGENYVQEALEKQELLEDMPDIQWHLIGHLQKNKSKQVVGRFDLIHSVDSLELAQALNKQCSAKKLQQKILVQVNVAGEETKGGFDSESLRERWSEMCSLSHLQICGLMTMPPLTENSEEVRPYFRELRRLRDELQTQCDLSLHPMTELSMGTSHDYQVAIEEGATIVRLGTILFGERSAKR